MPSKLAIIIALCAATIVIVFGAAAFTALYKKSDSANDAPVSMQEEITLTQISQHSKETDCWTFIGGQVFNATSVIAQYPEHKATLIGACGKDGSKVYTIQKYSSQTLSKEITAKLREALDSYQIGILSPGE